MKYSALVGNPVEHSVSPKLFQTIMERYGYEYAHIKIDIPQKGNLKKVIDNLFDLDFCGINITCPYKKDMFDYVDIYEDGSEQIHSINTIYKNNNKIVGCNTDGLAAIMSINREMEINQNTKVILFGAGGVAYSIFYELLKYTKNIIIIDRYIEDAKQMINDLNANNSYFNLKNVNDYKNLLIDADLIINATSVGMHPDNNSILSKKIINELPKNKVFFDVVFNPWDTKFIEYAKESGNKAVSGGYMLIYQATLALSKWLSAKITLNEQEINEIIEIVKKEIERLS